MDPHSPLLIAGRSQSRRRWLWFAALCLGAGCSQPGPFLQRQTMMGSLKSSVAQLESEKDLLSKQVADLRSENRRIQNELATVEEKNGELAARLDDARNLISRQGGEDASRDLAPRSASDLDRPSSTRAIPARNQPRARAAPFAQIPSERRPLVEPDELDEFDLPPPRARRRSSDDQSRANDRSPWSPIAKREPGLGGSRY